MDDFFTKTKCDRCGGSLDGGRIMSMYNEDCICVKCKEEETKRPDYKEACEKDMNEYRKRYSHTCCICGKVFMGWGNNPWPLKETGVCCADCNVKVVKERMIRAIATWGDEK